MPNKTCPKCGTAVNDRKLEKQSKRALEAFDDVIKRREQVKNHVALMRAKEIEQERASHRKGDKERKATSRAKETDLEKTDRRKSVKEHMAPENNSIMTLLMMISESNNYANKHK